ncbi:MAG: sigma-54 dependent transcriptional regulator [Desulfobacterales bacterium]|jgi:DNA-binding NtrC family response regulator
MQTILVVDDDSNVLTVLEARLSSAGFNVITATRGMEALARLNDHDVDLMITDMKMPKMGGMELFEAARKKFPQLPVIFLTAYGTIPDAVEAVKAGAVDFLAKPFDGKDLIGKLCALFDDACPQPIRPPSSLSAEVDFDPVKSTAMKELFDMVRKVSAADVNVLILGESGVGKERIARLIHHRSTRQGEPLITVDCGATPAGLLESELFGHVKGSFTHAVKDKKGLIEAAHGGTLFLDEIGNISPEMQTRLLRFIEERKIRRIGELKETAVDCRVISATNTDLVEDIEAGRFREDLYYRLRVVTLHVPPLRERKEDIPNLTCRFIAQLERQHKIPSIELPDKTLRWMCRYPWPGNVRELKNALEAGVVLCRDNTLKPEDLQLPDQPINCKSAGGPANLSLEETERDTIVRALKKSGGVQKDAAELLGISRRSIHYKIRKFNIDVAEIRAGGATSAS